MNPVGSLGISVSILLALSSSRCFLLFLPTQKNFEGSGIGGRNFTPEIGRDNPLRSAERIPLRLKVMMRTRKSEPAGFASAKVYTSAVVLQQAWAAVRKLQSIDPPADENMTDFRQEFLVFSMAQDVLRFGEFHQTPASISITVSRFTGGQKSC